MLKKSQHTDTKKYFGGLLPKTFLELLLKLVAT